MKGYMKRNDDFQERRKHLEGLSNDALKARFWELAEKAVDPLLELAKTQTTPAVERSVLLRMGFSSIEAKPLVEAVIDHGLIGKGAGHVVYKVSKEKNLPLRQAGLELLEGKHWDDAVAYFKGGQK
jgi:D-ornithine 4,5-aminomutase subunit alpha